MFEDLLRKEEMSILQLSRKAGVGYNYVHKIVKNQTDFDRCGLETAKKLADALHMDLNEIYKYKERYFQRKIYYQNQSGWNHEMYGLLNAELNKLFLIGIDYHFASGYTSRDIQSCKQGDMEISCIKFNRLSEETKCIMVAILNQQKVLKEFVQKYENLKGLTMQKPLKEKLYLTDEPFNIFTSYSDMNIAY